MSEQDNIQMRPVIHSPESDLTIWNVQWSQQGQPWRIEQEIDTKRQEELARYRAITPDIEKGTYPFKGVKLSRADVEWLLATHENGRGPVDWNDKSQRKREGLDLRGADLREADLHRLPLACLRGGLTFSEGMGLAEEPHNAATLLLKGTDLSQACLQKAILTRADLTGANLARAHLEKATLLGTRMKRVTLESANLRKADLDWADLEGSNLEWAHLERTSLHDARLIDACLLGAHLDDAYLEQAHLERSELNDAHLEGANLFNTSLADKDGIGPHMADIHWGDANLAVVDWGRIKILGDEYQAEQRLDEGEPKTEWTRLDEYKEAVRAYRQLAVVLRNQGLNEDAARFAYRAQLMQRKILWHQHKFGQYLFSLFLNLLTGYGYKPLQGFITYAVAISVFALIYFLLGPHLAWNEAVVISMTAFHGRGFFPDQFKPGDPQALVAAIEAFVGLLIEVTIIATLTQRLFAK